MWKLLFQIFFPFRFRISAVLCLWVIIIFFSSKTSYSQTSIWLEDFPYTNGTTQGSGIPAKWTIDVTACTFSNSNDYFHVVSNQMEGRDMDGEAVWTSESIDISANSDVKITIDVSESGTMESSDYFKVYYKIDGGSETLFDTNGNLSDDFNSVEASQTGLNGNNLVIVIRLYNNGSVERHHFDNIWVFEPVSGDLCSTAITINEVTNLTFSTSNATSSGDNPGCGGINPLDLWYAYTATATGNAEFDLCGSNYNTRLAIWDACNGNVLACNDNDNFCGTGSSQSYISMNVSSGITYYIQVGGNDNAIGSGDLSISVTPFPTNDDCANAISINEVTNLPFFTDDASISGANPGCGGTNPIDLWYEYTATTTGDAVIDVCGSDFDTRLAIWDACGGSVLACDDDNTSCGGNNLQSSLSIVVNNGSTYLIQVGGFNSDTGNGYLSIDVIPSTAPNDACSNAIAINEVSNLQFSTSNATAGGDNPGCGGTTDPIDLWYAYSPSSSGIADFDLCGSSLDTRLAIWDACSGNVLDCNDDDDFCGSGSYQSYISKTVLTGTVYYVQIAGYNADQGVGDLTISLSAFPTNDNCANATTINEVTNLQYNTTAATASGINPGCGGTNPLDIWYAYTATQTGSAQIDLCGSNYNTRLAVYSACGGSLLVCNDNSDYCGTGSTQSLINLSVSSGTTYYIQVSGSDNNIGTGYLTIEVIPFSTSDNCLNAIAINEVSDLNFTTLNATAGGDSPGCGGTTNPFDIWYAYTATLDGEAVFDLCGSGFDTRLGIWNSCGGSILACNDDSDNCEIGSFLSYLTLSVTSGTTYYVQIGGYNALTGNGDLSISVIPYATNDDCANAISINEVSDLIFTTTNATSGGDNPGCGTGAPIDIWYIYSPTSTGDAIFDLCGSSFDTRLAIYDACSGNIIACNNDNGPACSGTSASIEHSVSAGNNYYVQVGGATSNTGNGDLTISLTSSLNGQWVGIISSDWNTSGNWVNGIIPTSFIDAKIINSPPNYPDLNVTANCNNLIIGVNDSITINSGSNLITGGDLWLNGTFIMNNGNKEITGNFYNSSSATVELNGGTFQINGWFENAAYSPALGTISLSGGTINVSTDVSINSSNSNSVMNGPFILNIDGSLELESSSFSEISDGTINMKGSGHIRPVTSTGTFASYNLNIDGTGTYIFSHNSSNCYDSIFNNFNIINGTAQLLSGNSTGKPEIFYVGNNISISNGASLNIDVNNSFSLSGNWNNNGSFSHDSGILVFDGSTLISGITENTFGNTIINSGKTLTGPSSATLNISGNLTIDGTFSHNSGTLKFNGGSQTLNGSSQTIFNNLSLAGGSTVSLSTSGQSLYGIIMSDGTLNANSNITLLSSTTQTALIDGSGSGNVFGNVTMERYIPSKFGYRYISSPFTSATVNEFSGIVDLSANFPPVYEYDEDRTSSGWVDYSDAANIFISLYGYAINFGSIAAPLTFDMTGVVNNGSLAGISLFNNNQTYTQGFNLVGNPYPSPIDWEASSGWTKTNIDDAIYYFNPGVADQYGGTYSSYVNGVSSDGFANSIIPAMQGYFIHVSDGSYPVSATLSTNNEVRINDLSPDYHKSNKSITDTLLRISVGFVEDSDYNDPLVIYFSNSSFLNYDKKRDALKLLNTDNNTPNIYAISSDLFHLSIYSLPFSKDSITTIPLGLKTNKDGLISFYSIKIQMFPIDMQIYLLDKKVGVYHNLLLNPEYRIYLPEGNYTDRFSLVFGQKDIRYQPVEDEYYYVYNYGNTIYINFNTPTECNSKISIFNVAGQVIWNTSFTGLGYQTFTTHISTGLYIVNIKSQYGNSSKKLYISDK